MIPRIQTGTSFKGAGLYYLHDKRHEGEAERLTTERVAWTYAINTLENDPEAVLAEMRHTAFDQPLLKMLSGNRIDGRPTEKTVMTVALAWSPEQAPTKNDMIEAGHSFLQHMGWEAHQVLFVAHDDTKHPHVHLIINRVHPETGMTLDDGWAKIRSQKWALAYEKEHGHVFCQGREARYGPDGRSAKRGMTYNEWNLWREISKENVIEPDHRRTLEAGEWDALKGSQRDNRMEFWKDTGRMSKQLRAALREEVRAEFAPEWKAYALEKQERDKKTALFDREARHAIRHLRKQGGEQRRTRGARSQDIAVARAPDGSTYIKQPTFRSNEIGVVRGPDGRTYIKRRNIESEGIEQLKERRKAHHTRQREELWEMRRDIFSRQKERLEALAEPALEKLGADRAKAYESFLAEQRAEKTELRRDQRQGERRRDLLGGAGQGPRPNHATLTPEQTAAYIAHAKSSAARDSVFDQARIETTHADRGRPEEPTRDPRADKGQKEVTARSLEERATEQNKHAARRETELEWLLAKRAHDRARDRGGGRDR